ncbi:hypothetical protein TNCV_1250461 [Trichonephila clavipes]|nr:hypothetical protein TNCV_1250461 [Trichonephila clavipes]
MQEIYRKYPKTNSKLSGEYLRIFASTADERNEIIAFLKERGEQFFALHPQDTKPQKIVIKGLPISTDIDDIKKDLSDRGFLVSKRLLSSLNLSQNSSSPSSWWNYKNHPIPQTSSNWTSAAF